MRGALKHHGGACGDDARNGAAEEVARRGQRGGRRAAAADAVSAPGETGNHHEQGADQRRSGQTGREQGQKAGKGQGETCRLHAGEPHALGEAPSYHAELHGNIEDERSCGRRHGQIGEGEAQHVQEEKQGTGPGAFLPGLFPHGAFAGRAAHHMKGAQQSQHDRGGKAAYGGVLERLHAPDDQSRTAQDGVESKKRQTKGGGKKKSHDLSHRSVCFIRDAMHVSCQSGLCR